MEKLLRGGINTAILAVHAEVCLHRGERLYSQEVVSRFEEITAKLAPRRQPRDEVRSVERTSPARDSCSGFGPGNQIDFAFVNLFKPHDYFSFPR